MIRSTQEKTIQNAAAVTGRFLDIIGIVLTSARDYHARERATTNFKLGLAEIEDLTFVTYEEAKKLALEECPGRGGLLPGRPSPVPVPVLQSKPYPEMIELNRRFKVRYGLKVAVVSNESHERNAHRIEKLQLGAFCIFTTSERARRGHLSIGAGQPGRSSISKSTPMFVPIAEGVRIRCILHTAYRAICAKPASFVLQNDKGASHEIG